MSTAIQQYEGIGSQLTQFREPEQVMAEAQKAAMCLKKVLDMKPNKVMFNNEQYLEREDWGTVAKFYGCTAKVTETKYVEYGSARGFEAVAVCLDRNLNEIARAESMCLSEEENWGEVPVYEWEDELDANGQKIWVAGKDGKKRPKGKKVQKGTRSKPLFQLRSMAQTRAEAKVLKGVFGWVVVLAGYKPTPAEEMTGHEFDDREEREPKPPVNMPKSTDEKKPPAAQQGKAETVQQGKAEPQGKQETQQAAGPEKLSGEIKQVTPGKNGVLVLAVNGKVVVVPGKHSSDDFVVGAKVLCSVSKVKIKGQECLEVTEVEMVIPPAVEGEVIDAEFSEVDEKPEAGKPDPLLEEARAHGLGGIFDDAPPKATAAEASPAPAAGEATKPGTAGLKRAQRLHTLISQNHKNTGFGEDHLKRYLATQRLEHARDLACPPKGSEAFNAYEYACSMAVGEVDWHEILED